MSILDFIANVRHNRKLYKTGRADRSKKVRTKIVATTSREQIYRNVKAGATYTPPKKSGSGLHEFSYPVKKKK